MAVRINKPTCSGVIVTAEEVIEARLGIEEVAAVAEGVGVGDVGGVRGDNAALSVQHGRIAPGVVLILIEQSAGFVYNAYYIPLDVLYIPVIFRAQLIPYDRIIFVIKVMPPEGVSA